MVEKKRDWSENILSPALSCWLSGVRKGSRKEKGIPGCGKARVEA